MRAYQDLAEARPDPFIRYEYPRLLDVSRAAVAALLRVPADTVVFVSNATVGVNTILRNLVWAADGRDELLYFDTAYPACAKAVDFAVEASAGLAAAREIPLAYPLADAAVLAAFAAAVAASRAAGRRPRACLFDVVSSLPAVRFPFEALTAACRAHGVLSLVDGAQGVGLVDLDLATADPDFFVSNCHKWLHVPRGCAVLYVPRRRQALVRTTLATSHGFVGDSGGGGRPPRPNPLPPSAKSAFVANFEFVGTLDNAPYLCVADAIRWRAEVLGGEAAVREYTWGLARRGGARVAEMLGTEVMENREGTLGRCAMVNIGLPVWIGKREGGKPGDLVVSETEAAPLKEWLHETIIADHSTFIQVFLYRGRFWVRLSAQVYLDMDDFEFAGRVLQEMCPRLEKRVRETSKL